MNDESLLLLLSETLSNDNNSRRVAEQSLASLQQQGHVVVHQLSNILLNRKSSSFYISDGIQLIVLTYIKNQISRLDGSIGPIGENLVQYFLSFAEMNPFEGSNQVLIKMMMKIIDLLIANQNIEFQYNLLKLVDSSKNEFQSSLSTFYINVLLIHALTKHNRYQDTQATNELKNEISSLFPFIAEFLQNFQAKDTQYVKITYIIMKILNNLSESRSFTMFNYFNEPENLQSICETISQIGQVNEKENLKINKWIIKTFINFSNNQSISENMKSLNLSNSLKYITNKDNFKDWILDKDCRFGYYYFNYLNRSVKLKISSVIEPYMENIISDLIVSINTPNEELIDDFSDNLNDFMNFITNDSYSYEISIDLNDSSRRFINSLIKENQNIINPLIELCQQLITSSDNYIIVGGLRILDMIWSNIQSDEILTQFVDEIIEINNSLTSNDDLWLRCVIYNFFTEIKGAHVDFNNLVINLNDGNFENNQISLALLIINIRMLLTCSEKIQSDLINPIQIMQILLKYNETENLEIISDLIDLLIERYISELGPYSYELVCNLSEMFLQNIDNNNLEADNDVVNKLLGILNNILTIIVSINDGSIIEVLSSKLENLVAAVLQNASLDYLEIVIEICDEINLKCEKVYNLSMIIESFQQYGWEYYEYYENYLHNIYYFGDENDKDQMNEFIKWIINENGSDDELSTLLIELIIEKVLCDECEDNEFEQIIEYIYSQQEDGGFWNKKINIELVLIGIYKKTDVSLKMINNEIPNLINSLQELIDNDEWIDSLYDVKIGLVGLIGLYHQYSKDETVMNLISKLYSRLSESIESYNNGEDNRYCKSLIDKIDILELVKGI